jgi:hypothetical protein
MRQLAKQWPQLTKAVDDKIRSVAQKQGFSKRSRNSDDMTSSSLSGDYAVESILNDETVRRMSFEPMDRLLEDFWIGFRMRETRIVDDEIELVAKTKNTERGLPVSWSC